MLGLLETRRNGIGPLNLSEVCAIFSVRRAHSLQFARFRHTVVAREIAPHLHTHTTAAPVAAASCIDFLDLRLTGYWLAEAFWDIMSSAKHADL